MVSDELKDGITRTIKELQVLAIENKCSFNLNISKHNWSLPRAHIITTHEDKYAVTTFEEELKDDILFMYSRVGSGKCE